MQGFEIGLSHRKNQWRSLEYQLSKGSWRAFGDHPAHTKACFNRFGFDPPRQGTWLSRSLALTRWFKPALKSHVHAICWGLSRMAKPPRSGAMTWHP
jgi:hypothetical protein